VTSVEPTAESQAVAAAIARHGHEPGPLIVVLHAVQDALGYIPEQAVRQIADGLNLSRAEVFGVVTFYHYFRTHKPGARTVQICRAEACQARGCQSLERHAREKLGIDYHETTADGGTSLEMVFCMGNCATGPAVRIDGRLYSHVTPERFDALLAHQENAL
jgi:formate dehydrogenase subunit gamma